MNGYIDQNGNYYEAAKNTTNATEVPKRPTANHAWQGGAWVYVAPPLVNVKADKLAQMEHARQFAIATLPPVTVANKQYPATPEYRGIVTGIARRQAAGRPIPATLRGVDGTPANLNAALITQIDDAITTAVQAAWDRYWTRFDSVQSATTVEQVNAVEW